MAFNNPLDFSTFQVPAIHSIGKAYWDTVFKTLAVMLEGDSILQVGQETMCYAYNGTGSPIVEGSVVYIAGTDGAGIPSIALADASDFAKSYVLGVVTTSSIAHGAYGYVTIRGHVNDLKTDYAGWIADDELYLSDTVPGALTKTPPSEGHYDVRIGRIMIVHATTGRVYVDIRPLSTLSSLGDVTVTSPTTDQVLRYNGTEWVNGAEASSSAGKGVEWFFNGTEILPVGDDNSNHVETLSKTPWSHAEDVEGTAVTNSTVLADIYLYDTALGRTSITAGIWTFQMYAGVSRSQGVSTILQNLVRVRPGTGTITITDKDATHKTATASSGTPFAVAEIDIGGTVDSDSYLRTTLGVYRITGRTSDTEVEILVPSTYGPNEAGVAYSVHKRLFQITTPEINNLAGTGPAYTGLQLYTVQSVQSAFTVAATDKLAIYRFAKATDSSAVTIYFAYGGTTRCSTVESPLETLHGNLPGLQGGSGSVPTEEYYHLTSAQHTIATQAATTALSGYLATADWNTFNNKQDRPNVKAKTFADTGYNAIVDDSLYVNATGGVTSIVLPTAAVGNKGRRIQVKKTDASVNAVNVTVTGGGNIDGAATDPVSSQYESHTYESDGTQWWLI